MPHDWKYRYQDRTGPNKALFVGETYRAVVLQLHQAAWLTPPGKRQYMRAVADRVWSVYGHRISTQTHAAFLRDLVTAGLLHYLGPTDRTPEPTPEREG